MDIAKAEKSVLPLLAALTSGDYDAATEAVALSHLTAGDLRNAIAEYPFRLVPHKLPLAGLFDTVQVRSASHPTWRVNLPLWTAEEGRSDLVLQLTVVDNGRNTYDIELDDIHVL